MDLDKRLNMILQLTVEIYIEHAQPVSSAAVRQRAPNLGFCPATVRTLLAELEALGLLMQPHKSAGRIPTERGLRTYVNHLAAHKLHPWDRTRLQATTRESNTTEFPTQLGQALANVSGQMAMVAMPRFLGSRLREVGLIRCDAYRVIVYFVSPNGFVQQKLVTLDIDIEADELMRCQNYLNSLLIQYTIVQARQVITTQLAQARHSRDLLQEQLLTMYEQILPDVQMEVLVEGTSSLLEQPEFADLQRLRALVRTIEEKEILRNLLNQILATDGVQVMLASEHNMQRVADLACVGCSWTDASGYRTAIGLLGPSRMDYGRLMPLVEYATQLFGAYWEQL